MMHPTIRFGSLALLVLASASMSIPAQAQIYKWVDDEGMTHYSNQAPLKSAKPVKLVSPARPPVYVPELDYVQPAYPATYGGAWETAQQAQAPRSYPDRRASNDANARLAYDSCLAQRRVDCSESSSYMPSARPVVVIGARRQPQPFVPTQAITGLTAGNVTGTTGIMPGTFNEPGAITAGNAVTFGPQPFSNVPGGRR
jgi:hypothetical protein